MMKQFTFALLVASASAVQLSTYGDCDWECNKDGSGSPEEQWRSYGYPHRGATLKYPPDNQRWDRYLPEYAVQKAACNCASFVQRTWTQPYDGTYEWDLHNEGNNHTVTMDWANH